MLAPWNISRAACLAASIALHGLLFAVLIRPVMSARQWRVSGQPLQMTVFVGLGDSHAAQNASSLAQRSVVPILKAAPQKTRPGSGAIGNPTPKAQRAQQTKDVRDSERSTFLPSDAMDQVAVPVSWPDLNILTNVQGTGLPIRLRLFVDAYGTIQDIQVVQADGIDEITIDQLKQMFYATKFIAGRRNGKDTPSYLDIQLSITDLGSAPMSKPEP